MRKLSKNQSDRQAILDAELKLQNLGFLDYLCNLTEQQQEMLKSSNIQNYIAWLIAWKESVSTPCRPVFHASQATATGFSLNDLLAKGKNSLNSLQEMMIRWMSYPVGVHTDISKMYNRVALDERDWCYQRYLFHESLDPDQPPKVKVIKTVIYGVKPSGNLAQHCIRRTGEFSKEEFPRACEVIQRDTYVDDCITGADSDEDAHKLAGQLGTVLGKGGFALKGIAVSGKAPPESLSDDGVHVSVAGSNWDTENDLISLNIGDMSFYQKKKGRKPVQKTEEGVIPEKLTRRQCTSKVHGVYTLVGRVAPLVAAMKLDLHKLSRLKWDDTIPDELRSTWVSHFEMIQEMKNLKYRRAVVPEDAVDLNVDTIDFGDASKDIVCAAVYARFKRKTGGYSCQLVLARTKLVPDDMSLPRAELMASVLATQSSEVVRRSFYRNHVGSMKMTDSQIVLHWITNEEKPLKQWVRTRVIEIRRFTKPEDWRYVASKDNMADIGTRKGCQIKDVEQNSLWINGHDWMHQERNQFPVQSVQDVILSNAELAEVMKEVNYARCYGDDPGQSGDVSSYLSIVPDDVKDRYKISKYVIDPNRRDWAEVIRVIALVIRYLKILKERVATRKDDPDVEYEYTDLKPLVLSEEEVEEANSYMFQVATREVKKFINKDQYQKISKEVDGVLRYSGRILPSNEIVFIGNMTDAMKDLSSTSFCVPLVEKNSPIAYSIIIHVHWNSPVSHRGVETMWRYILKIAFIVDGKDLVQKIKDCCERCRYLYKKTIEVSMGPVSNYNLTVAPAFYVTQMDIAGPFKAYSLANKRAVLKIWMVVFVCATTSTTSIKVMEDDSTPSFLGAFIRLACEVGFPKILLADKGSQLVKGCNTSQLQFRDLKYKTHKNVDVEFELCPVGGHNMNGKVERMIQEIKKSFEKDFHNRRLSTIQWETVAAQVANSINDMPLALGNKTSNFEMMDLITPNRLRLGRNNERSPIGAMLLTKDYNKILEKNKEVFETWFENWLVAHVPKLIEQPKWFRNEESIKVGDVVLFRKDDKVLCSTYQYGMVDNVEKSQDGLIRKAHIRYGNASEETDRSTYRAVRSLVVIHRADETSLMEELAEISSFADYKMKINKETEDEEDGSCSSSSA